MQLEAGEDTDLLILAGPYEFLKPDADKKNPVEVLEALLRAYDLLPYDLGKLSSLESRLLGRLQTPIPDYWVTTNIKVETRVIEKNGHTIGVVMSPVSLDLDRPHAGLLREEALEAGKKLRGEVDFMIGLLSWGYKYEREFIEEAQGVFDVVLGGGSGPGQHAVFSNDRSVVLSRPSSKGKTVNRLDITNWTAQNATVSEPLGHRTRAQLVRLTGRYREHPDVRRQLLKLN